MNALGRGGVVIAMSSGLVATMGLPAQAVGQNATGPEASAPLPAGAPAAAPVGAAFTSAALAGPSVLEAAAPLTAPAAAKVSFESGKVEALPKPKAEPRRAETRDDSSTSRASRSSRDSSSTKYDAPSFGSAKGSSVLAVAARYVGLRYKYGGTSPATGMDCSGYTGYVFRQLGINLPRTAQQQMLASRRVSRSNAKPGDLVFVVSAGRANHVGIYAGGNMMYDSPRSGKTVSKRKIWSSSVVFGRVM